MLPRWRMCAFYVTPNMQRRAQYQSIERLTLADTSHFGAHSVATTKSTDAPCYSRGPAATPKVGGFFFTATCSTLRAGYKFRLNQCWEGGPEPQRRCRRALGVLPSCYVCGKSYGKQKAMPRILRLWEDVVPRRGDSAMMAAKCACMYFYPVMGSVLLFSSEEGEHT